MTKQEVIDYVKYLGGIETPQGWNVPKSVDLHHKNLTEIPIKFNIVQGSFYCDNNQLTSLKNCPKVVQGISPFYGSFWCFHNKLTSLKYCPKVVQGDFHCHYNKLTSLKYCPKEIKGDCDCSFNKLTSLKYCPKEVKLTFSCDKGNFKGKDYYKFLLDEKIIKKEEYLLRIL